VTLDRRELLRVLGATAAAGALGSLGCGGRQRPAAATEVEEDVRAALRDAVARLRERFAAASGWLATRDRTTVVAGSDARGTTRTFAATLLLRGYDGQGRSFERALGDVTAQGILEAAGELAALGGGGGRTLDPGKPVDHVARPKRDPARIPVARWLADLDETLRRAEAVGSSRIVWRAAHAVVDDERTWFVGDGADVMQRAVRVKSGLTLVAWSGTRPMIGEVVVARRAGLEALGLDEARVARAARRALELLTPGEPPTGPSAVVLAPSVTAALVAAGAGEVLTAARWSRPDLAARALLGGTVAAPEVSIVDDPTAGGFAGYAVDDEGWPAARTELIAGGALRGVLGDEAGAAHAGTARTGHGRRRHGDGAVAARPSDLYVAAGTTTDLLAALGDGLRIEAADGATVDPASWRVTVRARRARKVVGGKLTGHAWSDVEVRGTLPELLGGVFAIGERTATFPVGGDDAPPASVTAPGLATRAEVLPRRRG
jgi:predicted Zn-dependent protease